MRKQDEYQRSDETFEEFMERVRQHRRDGGNFWNGFAVGGVVSVFVWELLGSIFGP